MPERSVRVDLRMVIATWPDDAPRGAVTRFCERHGVSRSQFYEIRRRARAEGVTAVLGDRSRRPHDSPTAVRPEIEELAVRIRKELAEDGWDCGPLSVRARLLRMSVPAPSRATLARIFVRRGQVVPQPAKRPRSSWRRFEFAAPNECWQVDATEVALADGSTAVVLQVLDDHSRRLLASRASGCENARDAVAVVQQAIERFGTPQRLLSDNHLALNMSRRGRQGPLQQHLQALGVQPIASSPHHPQTCGKNERVHQTLKRWLDTRPRAHSLTHLQQLVDQFDEHYNTRRPHQALNGRTPYQAWNETPIAPAPTPPRAPARNSRHTPSHVTQITVRPQGHLNAHRAQICLGVAYAGLTITVLRDNDRLHLYQADGTHVRTVQLQPGRIYYGNNQPTGGRRQPRLRSSGMS